MNFGCQADVFQFPTIGNTCSLYASLNDQYFAIKRYSEFYQRKQAHDLRRKFRKHKS
jgi:hypothetical protein